jgi:ribose 5-phosphate isomerase A
MDPMDALKQMAAFRAVEQIHSDMVVGLGTGSTAKFAIERIGERLADGDIRNVVGIPSSVKTEKQAQAAGIPLVNLQDHPAIDITIDGADEVNPDLELIKGGGGALLREKILAQASRRNVIIVDESKLSNQLGIRWALPVEVVPFARQVEENYLTHLGASVELRKDNSGNPYRTDQKNIILDANFGPISNSLKLASWLDARAGIMAHGLFIGLATEVIVAEANQIRHLKRNKTHSE